MDSYYFIAYDENGEPYLEHAWLRRGQAHKYIMKIGEGLKARYFYTQAEVDAYMKGAKKGFETGKNGSKIAQKLHASQNGRLLFNGSVSGNRGGARREQTTEEKGERAGYRLGKATRETADKVEKTANRIDRAVRDTQYDIEAATGKAKSAAQRLNENTKSKMDKMREEFRKTADSAKESVSKAASDVKSKVLDKNADKLQKRADDLKGQHNATQQEKAKAQIDANNAKIKALEEDAKASEHKTNKLSIDKLKKQNDDLKDVADGNEIREEVINEKEIKENVVRDSSRKTKFSTYTKDDPDFDDKNFDEKNRAGDSDFFIAFRPDGSSVILEEDMKWVLPKGVNPRDPAIVSALNKDFEAGSNEEWVKQVTEAIDEAVDKERSKYPDPSKFRKKQ